MEFQKLTTEIKNAEALAVICHINPDEDTLGSGLALFEAFKRLGKRAYIFCDDNGSGKLKNLYGIESLNASSEKTYDLAIAVDCGDEGRLGKKAQEFFSAKVTANIDHHKSNDRFAQLNYVYPGTAATGEAVFRLLKELEADTSQKLLDKITATLLYTAILTDSGSFGYSSVTADTFRVAAELTELGADGSAIAYTFLKETSVNVFRLRQRILNKLIFHNNNAVCFAVFEQNDFEETQTTDSDTGGIVNTALNISPVKIAVTVAEIRDKQYKVSIRTKDGFADASHIATVFGGGGHKNAAGCRLFGYKEDVLEKLLKACNDELFEF